MRQLLLVRQEPTFRLLRLCVEAQDLFQTVFPQNPMGPQHRLRCRSLLVSQEPTFRLVRLRVEAQDLFQTAFPQNPMGPYHDDRAWGVIILLVTSIDALAVMDGYMSSVAGQ